ncbi:hypothetical protein GUITHDRAFT_103983 [Guillardia theta CCMP2712]|uniref:Uncharacterized protein n=1 Tax=Guillardia theta (strain CCMP2712) TaxID=905079 RepID=L1JPP9_GUITC|nr:hypothetical protein GUITHDRAFT_103983 [Guillardia theta CCMP2712]EKX50170.1 hypothetical protein GUITHDRAFT_103983 [Guillardia theta CCMP2712]|eukprot:XP_005837150.1 hypothetical protein GUITHDRAFT_103983 [Guillardia theta CCMP2712]
MSSPNSKLSQRAEALQALKGATAPPVWTSVKSDVEQYSSPRSDAAQSELAESGVKDESLNETGQNPVPVTETASESFYKLLLDLCLQIDEPNIEPFLRERVGKILKICTCQSDPAAASQMYKEFEQILCGTDFVQRHVMRSQDLEGRMCNLAIVYSIIKGTHEYMISKGYEGKKLKMLLADLMEALDGQDSNMLPRLRETSASQTRSARLEGPRELLLQAQKAFKAGDMERARSFARLCRNDVLSMKRGTTEVERGLDAEPEKQNRLHDIWAESLKILVEIESARQVEAQERVHVRSAPYQRFASPGSATGQLSPGRLLQGIYQVQYSQFSPERGRSELLAVWKDFDDEEARRSSISVKHWLFESHN